MESVLQVATYMCERYCREYGKNLDEMKLHKLLYFTQRESIIRTGDVMFDAEFRAWQYGPVVRVVRDAYKTGGLKETLSPEAQMRHSAVFDYIFVTYAGKSSYSLATQSHSELSWEHARAGYGDYDASDVPMKLEDMREDAERAKKWREESKILQRVQVYIDSHKESLKGICLL